MGVRVLRTYQYLSVHTPVVRVVEGQVHRHLSIGYRSLLKPRVFPRSDPHGHRRMFDARGVARETAGTWRLIGTPFAAGGPAPARKTDSRGITAS